VTLLRVDVGVAGSLAAMSRFLTPEWLDDLAQAAAGAAGPEGEPFTLQQLVTDGPDGDVTWSVTVGAGSIAVRPGRAEAPLVTFTQDLPTATAIIRGELSAQAAFMTGRLRVGGDVALLLERLDTLVAIDDVFAATRATTTY
jgi:putative sterol carrier protein